MSGFHKMLFMETEVIIPCSPSHVVKYSSSFDIFQLLKNVKAIFSSQDVNNRWQPRFGLHTIILLNPALEDEQREEFFKKKSSKWHWNSQFCVEPRESSF